MIRVLINFRTDENQNPIEAYIAATWRTRPNDGFLALFFDGNKVPGDGIRANLYINRSTIASVKPL